MNKFLVGFAGYPILVIENGFLLDEDELNVIRNLEYNKHILEKNLNLSKNSDILQLKKLIKLKNFFKESLNDYVSNVLEIENVFNFCQSWATIQNKKTSHPIHSHPNHVISSVYYAKAKQTGLTFKIPRSIIQEGFNFRYEIKNYNMYNSSTYTVPLKTGDLIFFPGQLHHESPVNDDSERIVVGASFFVSGKLGASDRYDNIDITNNKSLKYK
jgi:hypothetical protein